jgi:hypothetical protein
MPVERRENPSRTHPISRAHPVCTGPHFQNRAHPLANAPYRPDPAKTHKRPLVRWLH